MPADKGIKNKMSQRFIQDVPHRIDNREIIATKAERGEIFITHLSLWYALRETTMPGNQSRTGKNANARWENI